ncbi:MAG: hypothetical protein H7235_02655 [Bdellovibrionaceae bacterium]|nr:hypothetical protein [Pseudobdellovibrionaceae bacterium]
MEDLKIPIENFNSLAPATKISMQENLRKNLSNARVRQEEIDVLLQDFSKIKGLIGNNYLVCTTSGSSGLPGIYFFDAKTWGSLRSIVFSRLLKELIVKRLCRFSRIRWTMVIAMREFNITYRLSRDLPLFWKLFFKFDFIDITYPPEIISSQIMMSNPEILHCYPSVLEPLAQLKLSGRLQINPDYITSASEAFTSGVKDLVKKAFPTSKIREVYGATEFSAIACECPYGRLHINEDWCVVEAVDEEGNEVAIGTPSEKIYLTNLINRVQPVIRYEISDSIVKLGRDCQCGSKLMGIQILGKLDSKLSFKPPGQAEFELSAKHIHVMLSSFSAINAYQIEKISESCFKIYLVTNQSKSQIDLSESVKNKLKEYLESRSVNGMIIEIEYKVSLGRDQRSGKVKLFIN